MVAPIAVTREKYLDEAQFALFACQMVEEALKSILMYAREVNAITPTEYALVHKTDEQLDELQLGLLIKQYEKALFAPAIAVSLRALVPERNHCAHRALVVGFLNEVRQTVSLQVELDRIESAGKLAWSCFEVPKEEMQGVASRLEELRAQSTA